MQHETQVACLVDAVVRPRVEQDRTWTGSVLVPYQYVDRVPVDALAERRSRTRLCGHDLVEASQQVISGALVDARAVRGGSVQELGGDTAPLTPQVHVPDHDEVAAGPSDGDVPQVELAVNPADRAVMHALTRDEGEDHDVALAALEGVHAADAQPLLTYRLSWLRSSSAWGAKGVTTPIVASSDSCSPLVCADRPVAVTVGDYRQAAVLRVVRS
jgi:hypothetical protein